MFELGCYDPGVPPATCVAYQKEVEQITQLPLANVADGADKLKFRPLPPATADAMSILAVQRALKSAGFFPGAQEDGICGYRTQSAIRLFQEYVRSVEKLDCVPDGRFGPQSQKHLQRWLDQRLTPNWAPAIAQWKSGAFGDSEYGQWLALLDQVKQKYLAAPNRMLQMVNAFAGPADTRKVAQWDFSPTGSPQLIGIRRDEFSGKFDDIMILLIKGLVFKFQGSTEPGATENPAGAPFLAHGQHNYRFGWHRWVYLALLPQRNGVLVARAKKNLMLQDSDLDAGLEANTTINVHWAGLGMKYDVGNWSEGCQVMNGSVYIDAGNQLVNCTSFAAVNQSEVNSNPGKTRGAYNVLLDLVTALASDETERTIRYTLLAERDLALAPALQQGLADARSRAIKMMG